MTKSSHRVEVVPFSMEKHPDADSLSIVRIYGFQCVVRTDDWSGVTQAGYLQPDSVVDVTRPEFAFLAPQAKDLKARIKAKKLRGVISFGCLFPVPSDCQVGDDVTERFGVEHYEPPTAAEKEQAKKGVSLGGIQDADAPAIHVPHYDLDPFRRYNHLFTPGEPVVVTEKLDGSNCAYVFDGDRMHCRSRENWKREYPDTSHITREYLAEKGVPEERIAMVLEKNAGRTPAKNAWWAALERTPALEMFCRAHPGVVVFGELYGSVNCIKYGLPEDRFAAFDVMRDGRYLDAPEALNLLHQWGVPTAPILNHTEVHSEWGAMPELWVRPIPYDFEAICAMAEGTTLVKDAKPGTIREGVVVVPLKERVDARIGRVKMKAVSGAFLEKFR